ncbi:cysteine protease [Nitrospira sp. KM1]|uniref:C1 family peptidase n=1 Tax=Nitrospira sp. KM1 TaxID=1936990 RepID=UPI0013A7744B|nr:C1 family peptidase [Nitrospira sp. KM1]BCA56937.1 cysteine protease [Nitrospira sp. KM1]
MNHMGFKGMGWTPDRPDFRDYTANSHEVEPILEKSKGLKKKTSPKVVDLRPWCSPIEDQGDLGSCTANAGVGLMEYYQRRAFNKYLDGSRIFLYKATRNLLKWNGDTGAYLRDTMKAMILFGIPPEDYWPYNISDFDVEPPAFTYAFAQAYQTVKYYRHDPPGTTPVEALASVKQHLSAELPSMFGFTVYSSFPPVNDGKGEIPMPTEGETVRGGHAVVAIGYDDNKKIGTEKGALLIRNSWGVGWGVQGHGWMPYTYVEKGLAEDFWSIVQSEFTDTDLFKS